MAKYFGKIGFAILEETVPGVWVEQIVERDHYGDVTRNRRKLTSDSGQLNDNININNEISIVADQFAYQNFHTMRYAEYMGTKWKVTDVEVQHPRLLLSLGGIYNAEPDYTP